MLGKCVAQSVAACEVALCRELVGHVCSCICGHLWTASYVPENFQGFSFPFKPCQFFGRRLPYVSLKLLTGRRFKMELRLYRNKSSLSSSLGFELTKKRTVVLDEYYQFVKSAQREKTAEEEETYQDINFDTISSKNKLLEMFIHSNSGRSLFDHLTIETVSRWLRAVRRSEIVDECEEEWLADFDRSHKLNCKLERMNLDLSDHLNVVKFCMWLNAVQSYASKETKSKIESLNIELSVSDRQTGHWVRIVEIQGKYRAIARRTIEPGTLLGYFKCKVSLFERNITNISGTFAAESATSRSIDVCELDLCFGRYYFVHTSSCESNVTIEWLERENYRNECVRFIAAKQICKGDEVSVDTLSRVIFSPIKQ